LATSAIKSSFCTLSDDTVFLSEEDIHQLSHVDLIIASWPYQGMSMEGKQNDLQESMI
jgi:site-specific DNA-cytosine methylase